jgi:serine/threonine protein kinase
MTNGILGELLHGNNVGNLDWDRRYKIAVEVAHSLCYLHQNCRRLILHHDTKSNKILLDSNFGAHVAYFFLTKFLHHSDTSEYMSSVAGTFGYIAAGKSLFHLSFLGSFSLLRLSIMDGRNGEKISICINR